LEAFDTHNKIKVAVKFAKGEMPKLLASGDKMGYQSFSNFLLELDDFNRRWNNSMELLNEVYSKKRR